MNTKRKNARDKRFARRASRKLAKQSLPEYVNAILEDNDSAIDDSEVLQYIPSEYNACHNAYTGEYDYLTLEEFYNETDPHWKEVY